MRNAAIGPFAAGLGTGLILADASVAGHVLASGAALSLGMRSGSEIGGVGVPRHTPTRPTASDRPAGATNAAVGTAR